MEGPRPELEPLRRLRSLLRRGALPRHAWSTADLLELPRLYRSACTLVARLEASGEAPHVAQEARRLVSRAHAVLFRHRRTRAASPLRATWKLFAVEAPRAIRAEWRLLLTTLALIYGLAGIAFLAVANDLDLASSLLAPSVVEAEIAQLRETEQGEAFRGNFTFGLGDSSHNAGRIMANNMGVGVLFFASALVPPVYLLLTGLNALMLGTYIAVAWHWGQAGAISSILWCHGVLEIQALVLAGSAGLVLVRAWVRPGPWSRRHAMHVEGKRALRLFAPVFPLLFVAGLIEGFVSPLASSEVRVATAVVTGVLLLGWALLGGRRGASDERDGRSG